MCSEHCLTTSARHCACVLVHLLAALDSLSPYAAAGNLLDDAAVAVLVQQLAAHGSVSSLDLGGNSRLSWRCVEHLAGSCGMVPEDEDEEELGLPSYEQGTRDEMVVGHTGGAGGAAGAAAGAGADANGISCSSRRPVSAKKLRAVLQSGTVPAVPHGPPAGLLRQLRVLLLDGCALGDLGAGLLARAIGDNAGVTLQVGRGLLLCLAGCMGRTCAAGHTYRCCRRRALQTMARPAAAVPC